MREDGNRYVITRLKRLKRVITRGRILNVSETISRIPAAYYRCSYLIYVYLRKI